MAALTVKDLASFNDDQSHDKNLEALQKLGGLQVIAKQLKTDLKKGLSGAELKDLESRRKIYGRNEFPEPPSATWFDLFLESFEDTTIIVLVVAAVVSLAVGVYEDPSKGWIEGAAILSAVLIVALVTATNNYNKEAQFRKLNAVKDDVSITAKRDGKAVTVNVKELVVGDVIELNAGDKIPADGLLIDGSDVTCNESSLTGEPDDIKKGNNSADSDDLFLLSGTSVSTGYALMLVTAVGEQSRWGKTKAKLATETVDTPLQEKLDVLAGQIGNFGMITAALTFIAMIAIWFAKPEWRNPDLNLYEFILKAFIMGVTIVVVAVPEGLPLAVTLSLAFSTQKMMKDNNLIRVLAACETMGNATNICSDKTGTLTQNRMTVVAGWANGQFHEQIEKLNGLSKDQIHSISEGISVNSTANLMAPDATSDGEPVVVGNKTEGALLNYLRKTFKADYIPLRAGFNASRGDRLITFSSARKRMSVILLNGGSSGVGVCYTKGASEIILDRCVKYATPTGDKILNESVKKDIENAIEHMAKNALRTVAIAHKVIVKKQELDGDSDSIEQGLVLDAIFGIKDPLRPDVKDAVRRCQEAGIVVRMVTGDNIETAKAIARECGILTEGGIAMEGPNFRRLSPRQLDEILPKLQVLARSSPDDKHILVTRLNGHALPTTKEEWESLHPDHDWEKDREIVLPGYLDEWKVTRHDGQGEVVGVTGDGTNDGPALKAADVGLSMGLSGTEVAKEASDIVILDDNFSSIVKSVMWGRAVFDNIRKFLQFQLTVNVVALTLTFISALTGKEPPLNAVMMLWVNLIMDTMGALALGTEPPSLNLLKRKPFKRNASLISNRMYRNIFFQFVFQLGVLLYLLELAPAHFNVIAHSTQHLTIVFNAFVFCQVFNEINARSIGNDPNVFRGLAQNLLFIAILMFTVVAQYFIVEFGGDFVKTAPLTQDQWLKCISLGALSLPVGAIMRLFPINDSEQDFATVSPLIFAHLKNSKSEKKEKDSTGSSILSFSFLMWFITVTVIPVLTYQQFEEHWREFAMGFVAHIQIQIQSLIAKQ